MQLAIRRDAEYTGKPQFPLFPRDIQLRVGEVEAAVRATDHIVGPIQSSVLPALGNGCDRTIAGHARYPPVGSLAHDETPLPIQSTAVPFTRMFPNDTYLTGRVPAHQQAFPMPDVGQMASGVPEGAFGSAPSGNEGRCR